MKSQSSVTPGSPVLFSEEEAKDTKFKTTESTIQEEEEKSSHKDNNGRIIKPDYHKLWDEKIEEIDQD